MKFSPKGGDSDWIITHMFEYEVPEISFKIQKSSLLESVLSHLNPYLTKHIIDIITHFNIILSSTLKSSKQTLIWGWISTISYSLFTKSI